MYNPVINSWRRHYLRLERSYKRVQLQPWSIDEAEDNLAHYLTDCWHLKDWIKADLSAAIDNREVENMVNKSLALRIVGDLANATKHYERDRADKEGAYVTGFYASQPTPLNPHDPRIQRWTVTLRDGRKFDLDKIVADSWNEWQSILRTLKLLDKDPHDAST